MSFVEIDHCMRVEVKMRWAGVRDVVTVLHAGRLLPVGPVTGAETDTIAAAVWDSWVAHFLPFFHNDIFMDAVVATGLDSPTGPQTRHAPDTTTHGAQTAKMLPLGSAAVVTLYSDTRGRSGRGRMYLSGLTDLHMDDAGHLQAATATAFVEAASSLDGAIRGLLDVNAFGLCVASRLHHNYHLFDHAACGVIMRSQRRRAA